MNVACCLDNNCNSDWTAAGGAATEAPGTNSGSGGDTGSLQNNANPTVVPIATAMMTSVILTMFAA